MSRKTVIAVVGALLAVSYTGQSFALGIKNSVFDPNTWRLPAPREERTYINDPPSPEPPRFTNLVGVTFNVTNKTGQNLLLTAAFMSGGNSRLFYENRWARNGETVSWQFNGPASDLTIIAVDPNTGKQIRFWRNVGYNYENQPANGPDGSYSQQQYYGITW